MPATLTTTPSGRRLLQGPLFQRPRLSGLGITTKIRRTVFLCQPSTIEDIQAVCSALRDNNTFVGKENETGIGQGKEDIEAIGNLGAAAISGVSSSVVFLVFEVLGTGKCPPILSE